jgi:FtsZ-binding cell division protein ZapB
MDPRDGMYHAFDVNPLIGFIFHMIGEAETCGKQLAKNDEYFKTVTDELEILFEKNAKMAEENKEMQDRIAALEDQNQQTNEETQALLDKLGLDGVSRARGF